MKKANGVLAKALRAEINREDLGIKEVAGKIGRGEDTVYRILRGEPVSDRTIAQLEKAFPSVFA